MVQSNTVLNQLKQPILLFAIQTWKRIFAILPGFTSVAEYGSRQPIVPQEFGTVENVRFITTPLLTPTANAGASATGKVLSTGGSNADVYKIAIFGQEAYAVCPLKGKDAAQILVRNPGKAEKGDELGQNWFRWLENLVGW